MELLPADSEERLAKARKVWETIEAKSRHIEAQLRDLDNVGGNENEDAYSDLSAPFSDMGDVGFTKTASNKMLSKLESDTMLKSSKTPEYLRVQEEVWASIEVGASKVYMEDLGTQSYDYLVDLPQDQDPKLKIMMERMLDACRLPSPPPPAISLEEQREPKSAQSPENKYIAKSQHGEFKETHSLSEVWRMLEVQSTSNGFPVSPCGYNVFDDKRRLRIETGPWSEQEAARQKCEDWLKKL